MSVPGEPLAVRAATPADAPELVRLAEFAFASIGVMGDAEWRSEATAVLDSRIGGADLPGWVVDAPDGGLAGSALLAIAPRLPAPGQLGASAGYVQWVATDERYQRRGIASALMAAVMDHLHVVGIDFAALSSTAAGRPLYERFGFRASPDIEYPPEVRSVPMVWRAPPRQ